MEQENVIKQLEEFKARYSEFVNGIDKVFTSFNSIISKTGFTKNNQQLSIYLSELKITGIGIIASNLNCLKEGLIQMEMGALFNTLDTQLKNSMQNTQNDIKDLQEFPTIED